MNFGQAISATFNDYATFSGRARRSQYWWWTLFTVLVGVALGFINSNLVTSLVWLALLLPSLGVGVRRLHDTNRSGWWLLIGAIPLIGAIVLLVFTVQDSQRGPNKYGPSPKYPSDDPYGSWTPPSSDPYGYGPSSGFGGQP